MVGLDPEDENRHVLALAKKNLTAGLPSLAYTIEDAEGVAKLVWQGTTDVTAQQIVAGNHEGEDDEELTALDEAKHFLVDLLEDGPVKSTEVFKAARAAAVTEKTLRRAKDALGVVSRKEGGTLKVGSVLRHQPGRWVWQFPEDGQESPKVVTLEAWSSSGNDDHLREDDDTAYRHPDDIDPCPSCGKREGYDEAGRQRTCAECGHQWTVPA